MILLDLHANDVRCNWVRVSDWVRPLRASFLFLRLKVVLHGSNNELLDEGGRHAIDWGSVLGLPLNQGRRDVVAVPHAIFDRISRRHAVAAFVENTAGQKRSRLMPSLIVIDPLLVEPGLSCFKQLAIENGWLLSGEDLAAVFNLVDIELITQECRQRPTGEWDAADSASIGQGADLGRDPGMPQVRHQEVQAAELKEAAEDVANGLGLCFHHRDFAILGLIAQWHHPADPEALAF